MPSASCNHICTTVTMRLQPVVAYYLKESLRQPLVAHYLKESLRQSLTLTLS